ncbi:MAG: hypothetical protein ACTMHL_09235 [Janibacter sp.]
MSDEGNSELSAEDTTAMRVLGVVFLAVGITMGLSQGWATGIAFVVMGVSFMIIGWVRDSDG